MAYTIGAYVRVQGETEFSQKMKQLKQQMSYTRSEAEALSSSYDANGDKMSSLVAKLDGLKQSMELQKQAVEEGEAALRRMQEEGVDPASEGYQKMQQNVNNAKTALNKTKGEINDVSSALDGMGGSASGIGWDSLINGAKNAITGMSGIADAALQAAEGIARMVRESTGYADEVLTESQKLSMDTTTYQRLEYASKFVDVELSTMAKGFAKVQDNIKTAEDGLIDFGNGIQVTFGEGTTTQQVFYDVVDKLGEMEDITLRDAAAQEIFGKSYQDILPLINAGSEALQKYGDEAESEGLILSEGELTALGDANDAFDKIDLQITNLKNDISLLLLPAIQGILEALQDIISAVDTATNKLADFCATDWQANVDINFNGMPVSESEYVGGASSTGGSFMREFLYQLGSSGVH